MEQKSMISKRKNSVFWFSAMPQVIYLVPWMGFAFPLFLLHIKTETILLCRKIWVFFSSTLQENIWLLWKCGPGFTLWLYQKNFFSFFIMFGFQSSLYFISGSKFKLKITKMRGGVSLSLTTSKSFAYLSFKELPATCCVILPGS